MRRKRVRALRALWGAAAVLVALDLTDLYLDHHNRTHGLPSPLNRFY